MNIDLAYIYNVINSFKETMIDGERVEIIVTPKEENDKYVHADERKITIGLQGGLSRERCSFYVSNGSEFDLNVLPLILNYFSNEDNFGNDWNITEPVFSENTYKARLETESGNLLYLETFNDSLFEKLKNYQSIKPPMTNKFSVNQLFWENLINCAKSRATVKDVFGNERFTQEEKQILEHFLDVFGKSNLLVNSRGNVANKKAPMLIKKLFDSNGYHGDITKLVSFEEYEWFEKNVSKDVISKIDSDMLDKLGVALRGETKFNQFINNNSDNLGLSYDEIVDRKQFAFNELHRERVNYFGTGRKSVKIDKLLSIYEEESILQNLSVEQVERYRLYCEELKGYVEANIARRNRTETVKVYPSDENVKYTLVSSDLFNRDFDSLIESIKMCKESRVNDEKFELIIESDPQNKNKRLVRVALLNGISRRDNFDFTFDSNEFDSKISSLLDLVRTNDEFSKVSSVLGNESLKTTYIQTSDNNEILIKLPSSVDYEIESSVSIDNGEVTHETKNPEQVSNTLLEPSNPAIAVAGDSMKYKDLFDIIEMVKNARVDGERFEIVIDKGLNDTSKREVKITLLGGNARDSYNFIFDDGVSFDSILPKIFDSVCLNDKISAVKNTATGLIERTNDSISLFTTESKNEILVRYSLPETLQISNYLSADKVESGLSKNDREIVEYFRLNFLREVNKLPDIEKIRIEDLIRGNENIKYIEDLRNKLYSGEIKGNDFVQMVGYNAKHIPQGVILGIVDRAQAKKDSSVLEVKDTNLDRDILSILHQQMKDFFLEPKHNTSVVKENKYFEELHEFVKKFKIYSNLNGDLEVFFRESNEKYDANDAEKSKIQFAHFWASMAGVKSNHGDLIPGEIQAFGEESRNLFNIMSVQFLESIKKDINVDLDSLKKEFDNSGYPFANDVFERLFKNDNYIEFIKTYYKVQLMYGKSQESVKLDSEKVESIDKEVENELQDNANSFESIKVMEDDYKLQEEVSIAVREALAREEQKELSDSQKPVVINEDEIRVEVRRALDEAITQSNVSDKVVEEEDSLEDQNDMSANEVMASQIKDAYEIADSYSTMDSPASLKIFFLKDNPNMGQVTISHGATNDETVLLDITVSKDVLLNELLPEICNVYVENNSGVKMETFEVPNTNKAGLIALGKNDNLLQVSNATKAEVLLVQENIKFAKENITQVDSNKSIVL